MKSVLLLLLTNFFFFENILFAICNEYSNKNFHFLQKQNLNDTLIIKSNNHINTNVLSKIEEINGKATYYEDDKLLVSSLFILDL